MCWQARNKMLMVSLSMAAAGILACMAAVYDSLVPRGSLVAFLATMFPLALLVAGIVVSFVWLCEHFETSSQRRDERRLQTRRPEFPTVNERRRLFLEQIERRRNVSQFPKPTAGDNRYLDGVRGPGRSQKTATPAAPLAGHWHGQ
jgi:hypothetical protein